MVVVPAMCAAPIEDLRQEPCEATPSSGVRQDVAAANRADTTAETDKATR